jgi:hypothetical protein
MIKNKAIIGGHSMSANASVLSAPISFAIEFVQGHLFLVAKRQ